MNHNRVAIDTFDKLAELYQEKYFHSDIYWKTYDQLLEHFSDSTRTVLDVACGPGNVAHYLLDKRPELIVKGFDASEKMVKLARKNCPTCEFEVADARSLSNQNGYFDVLVVAFVLPYLSSEDAKQLIAASAGRLNENGLFFLSTMEGEPAMSGLQKGSTGDEIYINYHQGSILKQQLEESGFELLDEVRQAFTRNDGSVNTDLFLICRKVS